MPNNATASRHWPVARIVAAMMVCGAAGCSSRLHFAVRVVDATNGQPIEGATVVSNNRTELSAMIYVHAIFGSPEARTEHYRTDANGFTALTANTSHVVEFGASARAQGYHQRRIPFDPATVEAARKRRRPPAEPDLTISLTPKPTTRPQGSDPVDQRTRAFSPGRGEAGY
jgi:hypothetical protein